jgi:hypothetical protein
VHYVFTAMQSNLCYGGDMGISPSFFLWPVLCCIALSACGGARERRPDVLDVYELPRAGQGRVIYTAPPVDNDAYYTQPGGYQGCAQIGDAPSCAGGG